MILHCPNVDSCSTLGQGRASLVQLCAGLWCDGCHDICPLEGQAPSRMLTSGTWALQHLAADLIVQKLQSPAALKRSAP